MTLRVTPNKNGTVTIECDGESVTIAVPPPPQQNIPVIWSNDGNTASIVDNGEAKTEVVPVPSVDDLPKTIQEKHDLHAKAQKPIIFQFHVKGDKSLSIERINKTLSDLGNPDWMGTQIKLTRLSDE